MKLIRKGILLPILFVFLFLAASVSPAFAAGDTAVDWDRTGSISVTLADGDLALPGAEITLYRVAAAESVNNNLSFAYTADFRAFGETPEELEEEAALQRLADFVSEKGLDGISAQTDESGFVSFRGLSLGLYLVAQTGSVEGFSDCTPFLAALPASGADGWVYDVDAEPKTDVVSLIDITVKKVWNDDGKNRPESVTIQLFKGNALIDTVTLNEQNGWSYTFMDQPRNDAWSVNESNVPKGYTAVYQQNGFTFTVTNTTTLAQTGQLKWPVPVLAGAGLLLFTGGWVLRFGEKREDPADKRLKR